MALKTKIMGILNITPDSFYDGNRYLLHDFALKRAVQMYEDGADIIDIGGESTRPGAQPVSLDEELERILKPIEQIKKEIPVTLSIDTYKSKVAEEACKLGVDIVNDISGLTFDENLIEVVQRYNKKIIIMHIKGTPRNMQVDPYYENVVEEIKDFLKEQINYAESNGVPGENIIIDPGIGFGKRLDDNLNIIKNLNKFRELNLPVCIGVSRKSFIGKILDVDADERLEGSLASSVLSAVNGADILRVHDVKETHRALQVTESIVYS